MFANKIQRLKDGGRNKRKNFNHGHYYLTFFFFFSFFLPFILSIDSNRVCRHTHTQFCSHLEGEKKVRYCTWQV